MRNIAIAVYELNVDGGCGGAEILNVDGGIELPGVAGFAAKDAGGPEDSITCRGASVGVGGVGIVDLSRDGDVCAVGGRGREPQPEVLANS